MESEDKGKLFSVLLGARVWCEVLAEPGMKRETDSSWMGVHGDWTEEAPKKEV